MSRTFVLPDLGEGLIEAEIRAILVHEGDVVKEDSPLLEVETDKAQVEIPSPFAGRVEKIHVHPGQTVKVGEPLVSFADGGGAAAPARSAPPAAAPSTRRLARELGVELQAVRGTGPGGRITDADGRAGAGKAPGAPPAPARPGAGGAPGAPPGPPARAPAPAGPAKPLAAVGLEPPPLPRFEQWGPVERRPLSHLRRTIAERMALSAALIPHVTHF